MAESATKAESRRNTIQRMAWDCRVLTSLCQHRVARGWPKRGFLGVVADFAVRQKMVSRSAAKNLQSRVSDGIASQLGRWRSRV
jgi:hypothetical protein